MQVTRYRPDKNTQPVPVDYEVPLRKEWTVLDGLNHIKAERDETLSFRWSCRMGICGSCGMNVDGEPRLTCGTFLSDYAPGPGARGAAGQLPGRQGPGRRHERLHGEAPPGQAVDHPRRRRDRDRRGVPPDARGARRLQAVQHVHQLHALLRRLPGLRPRPRLRRPGRDRPGRALRPRLARPRCPRASRRPDRARGRVGLHLRRRVHEGVSQARRPRGCHPALQAQGRPGVGEGVPAPEGAADEHSRSTRGPVVPAADGRLLVGAQAVVLPLRDARAEQPVRRVVRGLPADVHRRRRAAASRPTTTSSTARPAR